MAADLVQFEGFELDRAAYLLRRKGRVVRLQRIPMDLLLLLVERRGQLVTRDEIRNRIWGANVFVDTESSINTAIRKLRQVLRDRPGSPRFIETVAAKGYRFIAATDELEGSARPANFPHAIRSPIRKRVDHTAGAQIPFVGRKEELGLLLNRWQRALDGEGQVVLVIGEPGIGKSRLLQHFRQHIAPMPHSWVEAAAAPFFQNTPFYPVVELLRNFASPRRADWVRARPERIEARLASAGLNPAEAIPLLAPLLNLPVPVDYAPLLYSPEQRRRRLLAVIVEWIFGIARGQPLVIAIEDLHWLDASTLELIQLIIEQGATGRLLLLCTARPEFRTQWPWRSHHTPITLNRLSVPEARVMAREAAGRKALSDEAVAAVIERTSGVPLFVEELARAVVETGDENLACAIPDTLHDSLMARLDRLGAAREVAQVAAVVGGEFSYELLHAVHPIAEDALQHALHTLADAEILYVRGIIPEAVYQFKHALIRDTAYQSLVKSRRIKLHHQVVRTIEEKFSTLAERHPELLARHWSEGNDTERAILEWDRAGKAAEHRNAFKEALGSYHEALKLLGLTPDTPARDARELALRQAALVMLLRVKGGGAPEAIEAAGHAMALARKSGISNQFSQMMSMTAHSVLVAGDLSAAAGLAHEALALALEEGDPQSMGLAHGIQLLLCYFRGDLAGVEGQFAAALELFEASELDDLSRLVAILGFSGASSNAYLLGRIGLARLRQDQMRRAATHKENHYEVGSVGFLDAWLHNSLREYEKAEAVSAPALELAAKGQFPELTSHLRIQLGHARAQLGRFSQGIALVRQGIGGLLEMAPHPGLTSYFTFLAAAQQKGAKLDDAFESIEQALSVNPAIVIARPEALRTRGELWLSKGQTGPAEADFRASISLARSIGAKAWELRATTSLARLFLKRGRHDEARAMLADIYNWFTEGFDTADLKDAKTLLDELSAG
jgi:DNA-binding winged helix-turn-helix (wHTH) protein/tetratricopeptide (TPR) repeat protein